ncbi:hypothetical protein QJS10_CPB17g00837 [Acorus calamus]|uniref:Charged multivesicular body protein 7 n=1 Tax=Acorus calamus TaxID=4465 RepID=A0AAV9CWZ6_ACOCL|nr:hypothetical protein QJS10_CPB17g00837 [Acorus calamus]
MESPLTEFIRREVPDWDDDIVSAARFKALSGQRSDWEHRFFFWRDLILKVARHLGIIAVRPSEVCKWFTRGGLRPLCIDRVLLEMYNDGDLLRSGDLVDPTSGQLFQIIRKLRSLMKNSKLSDRQEIVDEHLIIKPLLQERATETIQVLSETHWTSNCVITMEKFRSICKGSDEATAVLSNLYECGKARFLSSTKQDFIEGVKLSLVPTAVTTVSNLDHDVLYLTWTTEKLQKQLDVIDQHCVKFRKLALASLKSGNKQIALRHVRQLKSLSESRNKCTSFLDRVEEVLSAIADAESTKKVSEAIQIGARAIKQNGISAEEVHLCLSELDESVASQKEVEEALESMQFQYMGMDDEDLEEEFKNLELELGDEKIETGHVDENARIKINGTAEVSAQVEQGTQHEAESLSQAVSKLKLEAA